MKNYQIFDVNRPLLEERLIIKGNTPIDAVRRYLRSVGSQRRPKRSGSNYVQISAQELIERDGVTYRSGNQQWYELY